MDVYFSAEFCSRILIIKIHESLSCSGKARFKNLESMMQTIISQIPMAAAMQNKGRMGV